MIWFGHEMTPTVELVKTINGLKDNWNHLHFGGDDPVADIGDPVFGYRLTAPGNKSLIAPHMADYAQFHDDTVYYWPDLHDSLKYMLIFIYDAFKTGLEIRQFTGTYAGLGYEGYPGHLMRNAMPVGNEVLVKVSPEEAQLIAQL